MHYEPHPLCLVLPPMKNDEYDKLRDDIKANGLMHPIILHEGMILDGRHRYRACNEAGVEPRFRQYEGNDPSSYVVSSTMHRSLTATQRALIAAGLLQYEREEARKRQAAAGGSTPGPLMEGLPQALGPARDKAGARVGVSGRSVDTAAKVLATAQPEIVEMLKSGEMALEEAKNIVKLNPVAQRKIASIKDGKERKSEVRKAVNYSTSAKLREAAKTSVIAEPGTPFLRKLLSGFERLSIVMAEDGMKDAASIADRFAREMDWTSQPLRLQYERCIPAIQAAVLIASGEAKANRAA